MCHRKTPLQTHLEFLRLIPTAYCLPPAAYCLMASAYYLPFRHAVPQPQLQVKLLIDHPLLLPL